MLARTLADLPQRVEYQGGPVEDFLSYMIRPLERQRRLKVVLGNFEPPPLPVSIVYPHARLLSTRVRVFVDWLAKKLPTVLAE